MVAVMRQPDLFAPPKAPETPREPNLPFIRKRLKGYLRLARDATILPWSEVEADSIARRFPSLASALPAEEAAELCAAFQAELNRLRGRQAA